MSVWWIALLFLLSCSAGAVEPTPNIVLIIGDDHGYPDFGFMGSPHVQTPNLDRLAQQGSVFTHGYNTESVCKPSLRSLLTGLHPLQWEARIEQLLASGLQCSDADCIRGFVTLPRLLAERGYASFQGGKFWEADYEAAGFTHGMQKSGAKLIPGGTGQRLGRKPMDPLYEFIDTHVDRPFFVWFAPLLPHGPFDASLEYRRPYMRRGLSNSAILYYANVTRFDDVVGQLLRQLEERGLRERTLIVYVADNGWDQPPLLQRTDTWDGPRRKMTAHELGVRTPIIFFWPGVVPSGVVSDALVSTVDLFPTLLDYAGAPQRSDRPGRSLRGLLQEGEPWKRSQIIGRIKHARGPDDAAFPHGGSRNRGYFLGTRRWWYIWYQDTGAERLYDLSVDPRAARDIASLHRSRVEESGRQVVAWREQMRGSMERPAQSRTGPAVEGW